MRHAETGALATPIRDGEIARHMDTQRLQVDTGYVLPVSIVMHPDRSFEPERWGRLKEHLADLAEMEASHRDCALDNLVIDDADREWLRKLAGPLLTGDSRLSGSLPLARSTIDAERLRWRNGETIGRYRIQSLLGRGGMGEVYEARSLDEDRIVALKVLRAGLNHLDYARFSDNEQRALRRLDDPRIAKFIEAFVDDSAGTCIVLEWVDGEPLQTYCSGRRFDVEARLKLFVEVCHAVASAHQQLVVHRDLKPSNVLVTPEGQVKLLDFGVSKLLDAGTTGAQTQTRENLFTLDYAAPEQVLHEAISTATDIYSLGVLLFRLLTDVSPYPRADGKSLVKAVLEESPQKISDALERSRDEGKSPPTGSFDLDLDRIVARAMDKDPRSRYRNTLELAADIEAVLAGRPISSGGNTRYRLKKFLNRNRASAAGAAIAFVAIIVAGIVSVHETRLTARHAHQADVANHFLMTTLDLTDKFSSGNRADLTLGEVLERSVAKARTELVDEPAVRATVMIKLALALQHRGKTQAALQVAEEAFSIRKADIQSTPIEKAEAAQQLASAEIESGLIDQADEHLHEAVAWLDGGNETDPTAIAVLTSLGKLASMRGDAKGSLAWYQRTLALRKTLPGDHRDEIAMDYNNVGTGLYNLSRFHESDDAYSQSIAMLQSRLGDAHPRLGFVLVGRAGALIQLGHFKDAIALLDQSDSILSSGSGRPPATLGAASSTRLRAMIEFFGSDYRSALDRMDPAISSMRVSSPVTVASMLVMRARIELADHKPKAAADTLTEAERLFVNNGRATHVQRWVAHGLHGVALVDLGDHEKGDEQLDEAFRQISLTGRVDSVELAEIALQSGAEARRRGDVVLAIQHHRIAQAFQSKSGWLGGLGKNLVAGELVLDGMLPGAGVEARRFSEENVEPTLVALQKLSPNNPLVNSLDKARVSSAR